MSERLDFLMEMTRPHRPEDRPGVLVPPSGVPEEDEAFVRQVHDTLQQHGIYVSTVNQDARGYWQFEVIAPGQRRTGRIIGYADWIIANMAQILDTYKCEDPRLLAEIHRYIASEEGLN